MTNQEKLMDEIIRFSRQAINAGMGPTTGGNLASAYCDQLKELEEKAKRVNRDAREADKCLEERIELADEIICDHADLEWCTSCSSYTGYETQTISGRVGHIDNWLPDEVVATCDGCGANKED
jgi:hypothetical protein